MNAELKKICRVLIVDDNEFQISVLKSYLKNVKYMISTALNGIEALKLAKDNIFDLILLDIAMPEMDGFEVCKQMKKMAETKDVPIIFLTAQREPEEIVKGLKIGANDYITKPFCAEELIARMQTHLQLKKSRDLIIEKNSLLSRKNEELESALNEIKTLKGMLPICANCKKIRMDKTDPYIQDSWIDMEEYISGRSDATFTHSICPECSNELYPGLNRANRQIK